MVLLQRNVQNSHCTSSKPINWRLPTEQSSKGIHCEYGSPMNNHIFIADRETSRDKDILGLRRELTPTRQCPNSMNSVWLDFWLFDFSFDAPQPRLRVERLKYYTDEDKTSCTIGLDYYSTSTFPSWIVQRCSDGHCHRDEEHLLVKFWFVREFCRSELRDSKQTSKQDSQFIPHIQSLGTYVLSNSTA